MSRKQVRCAIYTRKSSDEGLDQDFNSLDAQYEACAAYITSQQQEGWKLVKTRYDDGGISGGTLQRPALQRLLADIEAGLIDRIIVYKIDRLTRSLSDFSKIVDRLDASDASFVSITQSFNTATSMGRLTLNMLLSFAQFEREVTAERIRDKIAASKAKGLWMGGTVPMGYQPHPDKTVRGLIFDDAEAKTISTIFALYRKHGCLRQVELDLVNRAIKARARIGKPAAPFSRGAIHKILTNPIYIGKIRHKDKIYDGKQEAIIDDATWDQVQTTLQANSQKRRGHQLPKTAAAWLKGKLFDPSGDLLTPSHTKKDGKTIRYYLSNRLIKGKDPTGWRLPAKTLEPAICAIIADHLFVHATQARLIKPNDVHQIADLTRHVEAAFNIDKLGQRAILANFANVLRRGDLTLDGVKLALDRRTLADLLNIQPAQIVDTALSFTTPIALRKRGVEMKMIAGTYQPEPNTILQNALAHAHLWIDQIQSGTTIQDIAKTNTTSQGLIRTRIRLGFLSPKIQKSILNGTQPIDLTLAKILRAKINPCWETQEKQLGY